MRSLRTQIISCPLPFIPHKVNAYLIETSRNRILFDTGIRHENAIEMLDSAIQEFGGIDAILISHGHLDHAGIAQYLSEKHDAPVHISFEENDRISMDFMKRTGQRIKKLEAVYEFFGMNMAGIQRERTRMDFYKQYAEPIQFYFNPAALKDPDISIIELPGHTAGSIGLYCKETGELWSGDAFLQEGISPFFDVERLDDTLRVYRTSLDTIYELNPSMVFPGHGASFTDCRAVIEGHRQYIEENMKKIQACVEENKTPGTLFGTLFSPGYNPLIAIAEIIHALEQSKIPVLQDLKERLSQ